MKYLQLLNNNNIKLPYIIPRRLAMTPMLPPYSQYYYLDNFKQILNNKYRSLYYIESKIISTLAHIQLQIDRNLKYETT